MIQLAPSAPRHSFVSDERGTVAIVFALSSFALFSIVGLAIDMGRAYHTANRVTAAVDAAALAAAKSLRLDNLTDGAVRQVAETYFYQGFTGPGGIGAYAAVNALNVELDRSKGAVSVSANVKVPTLFAGIAGIYELNVPWTSVAIFDGKDLEVGVQLDLTGSMAGSRIAALKSATKNLIDVLIPDAPTGQKVRIAFAPFSAGVNVGPYLQAVDGNRPSANTCVYERLTPANEKTDAAPIGPDAFKIRTDLTGNVQPCPTTAVVPMTDNKATLKAIVNGFKTTSSTAGQLGTAWAWYLLSPNWGAIWPTDSKPAPYNDGKTFKSVLIMTDGEYNTIGGVNANSNIVPASQISVEICSGMKAKGIVVYTVGFQVGGSQTVLNTLTTCASEPAKFYRAENADELDAAFREIATDIVSLRLSR